MTQCAGQPEATCCPFARTRRNTDRFHFWFGFARRLFRSSSSSLAGDFLLAVLRTAAAPTNKPSSRGVCHNWGSQPLCDGRFVFVNFGPRLILLYADHQPPGPNCQNLCLITHSLTDELLWPLVLLPEVGSNQIQILVTTVNWIFIILIICTLLENSFFKDFLLLRPTFVHKYLYFVLLTLKKACYFCV